MKKLLAVFGLFLLPFTTPAQAAGGHAIELTPAENNLRDQDSLKRGAILFSNYCMACHSAKYIRYNRIARDIGWTDDEIIQKMTFGQNKVVDTIQTRMVDGVAMDTLGSNPPDLSLMTRVKGTDYVYTFLTEYYQDEEGKWDNHALQGTSMPNVLEGLQRHETPEDYAQAVRDISNFLEYVGEPAKLQRLDLGWKVIAFLLFLLLRIIAEPYPSIITSPLSAFVNTLAPTGGNTPDLTSLITCLKIALGSLVTATAPRLPFICERVLGVEIKLTRTNLSSLLSYTS